MPRLRSLAALALLTAVGCNQRPSRDDALAAFHRARPGFDSSAATIRVWADGPPWFSCAEVLAKLKGPADHAVIRDQLGSWRPLVLAEWVTLRDTAAGRVVEPGWCTATLRDDKKLAPGWREVSGDSLASGGLRRGWDVQVGTTRVVVPKRTTLVGKDSARAVYVFTIAPNTNGVATGAEHESSEHAALLTRVDGQWRLEHLDGMR
jgi:hypothetical protein